MLKRQAKNLTGGIDHSRALLHLYVYTNLCTDVAVKLRAVWLPSITNTTWCAGE
jgi:hypothetical protein